MKKLIAAAENMDEISLFLACGADEVITALPGFSMTAMPAVPLAQIEDPHSVSFLMNRLFFPEEIPAVRNKLKELAEIPFAHLYFADPCIALLGSQLGLADRLIYRPETLITSAADAQWWLSRPLSAVSISPLITQQEVIGIGHACSHAEVTIHGRLWLSVSRRRLLSDGMEDARFSADHHLSIREEKREGRMPIYEDQYGTIIYTDFIQQSFASIRSFDEAGIERFVITRAFQEPEACADAIRGYRDVLEGADGREILAHYQEKWKELPLSTGYYGQKTIR